MFMRYILVAAIALALPQAVLADGPEPVTLAPIQHVQASLTIVSPDGTTQSFSPAALEGFTTYSVNTTTPWREQAATFEGVMLHDILQSGGLHEVDSIKVTAENDYVITMPRALWDTVPIMVATRVDGRPLSRRERGPIQFIIDSDSFANSDIATESHLVWMAARIEAE